MLLGVFAGLVVGVLVSFGIVWYLNKTPLPFQNKVDRIESLPTLTGEEPPLPGKPGDKVEDRRRFEFYDILTQGQGQVSETRSAPSVAISAAASSPTTPPAPPPPPTAPIAADTVLYLQVGAFPKVADADRLKAKMSMLGAEVNIQEVNLPEKGIMHRVRIGPFDTPEEMNRVRTRLMDNGVQSSVVKVKTTKGN